VNPHRAILNSLAYFTRPRIDGKRLLLFQNVMESQDLTSTRTVCSSLLPFSGCLEDKEENDHAKMRTCFTDAFSRVLRPAKRYSAGSHNHPVAIGNWVRRNHLLFQSAREVAKSAVESRHVGAGFESHGYHADWN